MRFEDARKIFDGYTVDAIDDRTDYGEERIISIGLLEEVAILAVVHTDRKATCRIISARPANKKERKSYEEAIHQAFNSGAIGKL